MLSEAQFQRALSLMQRCRSYEQHSEVVGTDYHIGWAAYPEYPITVHRTENAFLLIEGRIYDRDTTEITQFADEVDFDDDRVERFRVRLELLLRECDAETVVVYVDCAPGGQALIVNDSLGRLPVYWAEDRRQVIVGRDSLAVTHLCGSVRADRCGVAETLLFGFPLGARTLFDGVRRLPPAVSLCIGARNGESPVEPYEEWDFSEKSGTDIHSASDTAAQLAETFVQACRDRAARLGERPAVLFLSGGLDSRAVAGGLVRAGVTPQTLTYVGEPDHPLAESEMAARVAAALGCAHETLTLREPRALDRQWAVEIRNGLTYAALGHLRQVYDALLERYGHNGMLFTGDGGDKVMPPLRPPWQVKSDHQLLRILLARGGLFGVQQVCRLTGMRRKDLIEFLLAYLDGYPEKDPGDKLIRFAVFERGYKWLFDGEDRSRMHMWSTSPFYAPAFFRQGMAIPQSLKRSRVLYTEFLRTLSPALVDVPDSNTGQLPGEQRDRMREQLKDSLGRWPRLDRLVRQARLWRRMGTVPRERRWSPEPLQDCDTLAVFSDGLDLQAARLMQARRLSALKYWQLVTVLWAFYQGEATGGV
jgi:asparagine synthase (glutamine-hydrolysing)